MAVASFIRIACLFYEMYILLIAPELYSGPEVRNCGAVCRFQVTGEGRDGRIWGKYGRMLRGTCMKRLGCFFLSLVLLGLCCVSASAEEEIGGGAALAFTYTQCDERWAGIRVGILTIAESACGIATVCNAVYYLTGQEMDLVSTAVWANQSGLFNTSSAAGCYRSVFYHAGEEYGEQYGFSATSFIGGSIRSQELIDHLLAGGTAALHVPGHFIAGIAYDEVLEKYLIIDPMPGDNGQYDTRRKGLTHTDGDWKTAEELSEGYLAVDGYALFSRTLSSSEREAIVPVAAAASLAGLLNNKG